MILISKIEPIDRTSPYDDVSDLELEYLIRMQEGTSPASELIKIIKQKKKGTSSLLKNQLQICNYLLKNINEILIETPDALFKRVRYFQSKGWDLLIYQNGKSSRFGKQLLKVFGYTSRFRSQVSRGIWLAQHLNIKSCPYCNSHSTLVVINDKGKSIAKLQFDHFFNKDQYPYLSVSLYNLIPCCANCNITKSSQSLNLKDHYNPYFTSLSSYFKFRLKYKPNPSLLTISKVGSQNLEIELKARNNLISKYVQDHDELYHLTGIYNRHQDLAEDILIKAIIYTQHLITSHLAIQGLFPDKKTYLRYLLGNYSSEKETLKRPLAKFTKDIAEQLGLK